MNYCGDFAPGQEVYIWFNTFDSNDPSASVTMTTFIDTDVHIHKDDSLTQRNNAAGVEVDVDVDGIAGVHKITIHTDDNTVADFWEAGHDYAVRIEGATVDAALINPVVGTFSIANRRVAGEMCRSSIESLASQTSFTLTSGEASAQDDAYNNCMIIVTDQTTRIQKALAYISDYTGATRTITLIAAPLATGFTMAVGDSVEILATAAFANVGSWNSVPLATTNPLPNAASDAAGGLPISDAGGLDLDALDTAAVRLTAARAQAIDDWINGGRLDLLLDAIPTTAMRGTDSAATETKQDAQDAIITEARLAELDAGNLPTDIAAIPTTAMRGTDNAATETKQDAQDAIITEARLAELDAGNLPTDIAAIPTTMVGTDNAATEAKQDAQDAIITEARLAELDAANLPADIDGITATVDAADESIPRNDTFNFSFRMVDATDGFTLEPGLTVTGTCSIDGAAFTNITGTIAETAAASGVYRITGAAADSNGVEVVFKFASAGARTKLIFARTRVVV